MALNVGDLDAASAFYRDALGFSDMGQPGSNVALAKCLGAQAAHTTMLRRGGQFLELCECEPRGAPVPSGGRSNDAWFQHFALVAPDMQAAYARLCRFAFSPISRSGPQVLPGGIVAFKFRDPEGHPLELIAFPHPDPATALGIDHSAICATDLNASVAFYEAHLGLVEQPPQLNHGPAQDALDDLDDTRVDVVALAPAVRAPHVELLIYRHPSSRKMPTPLPGDRVASRLVFSRVPPCGATEAGTATGDLTLLHDPDGHAILLDHSG